MFSNNYNLFLLSSYVVSMSLNFVILLHLHMNFHFTLVCLERRVAPENCRINLL
jgi:hypothetical protein